MHISERPLNSVSTRTVRWQPQQHKAGVTGQPLCDGFGFMNAVVLQDDIATRHPWCWVSGVQQGQELSQQELLRGLGIDLLMGITVRRHFLAARTDGAYQLGVPCGNPSQTKKEACVLCASSTTSLVLESQIND